LLPPPTAALCVVGRDEHDKYVAHEELSIAGPVAHDLSEPGRVGPRFRSAPRIGAMENRAIDSGDVYFEMSQQCRQHEISGVIAHLICAQVDVIDPVVGRTPFRCWRSQAVGNHLRLTSPAAPGGNEGGGFAETIRAGDRQVVLVSSAVGVVVENSVRGSSGSILLRAPVRLMGAMRDAMG
jgi:hypothetical protein